MNQWQTEVLNLSNIKMQFLSNVQETDKLTGVSLNSRML